jgi:hypothetical protein
VQNFLVEYQATTQTHPTSSLTMALDSHGQLAQKPSEVSQTTDSWGSSVPRQADAVNEEGVSREGDSEQTLGGYTFKEYVRTGYNLQETSSQLGYDERGSAGVLPPLNKGSTWNSYETLRATVYMEGERTRQEENYSPATGLYPTPQSNGQSGQHSQGLSLGHSQYGYGQHSQVQATWRSQVHSSQQAPVQYAQHAPVERALHEQVYSSMYFY